MKVTNQSQILMRRYMNLKSFAGYKLLFIVLAGFIATAGFAQNADKVGAPIPITKVWSGHPVGFDFLTTEKFQYACFYDADRNMTIAQRPLDSMNWKLTKLPSVVGWDSHNYVKMVIDKKGYIHVSGNMHNVKLIYFRSAAPENIDKFDALPMTGKEEDKVTYPVFFKNQSGDLFFQYRSGISGQGTTYWNKYDEEKQQWSRAFDTPIFDGENEANAYMQNPVLGPDGYFYVIWMWRATFIANTNHNLSCIRSKDFTKWETMGGKPVTLPIKWRDTQSIVDPVGPWNGLINMGFNISWHSDGTAYISYHKYDGRNISQVYVSKWEGSAWKAYQISNWPDHKWDLDRGGSLGNDVAISAVKPHDSKSVSVNYHHAKHGDGTWILDAKTLKVKGQQPTKSVNYPIKPQAPIAEGMSSKHLADNTGKYVMRWQTLPVNQDKPRKWENPVYSELVVFKVK